jgi:hypothetical protein
VERRGFLLGLGALAFAPTGGVALAGDRAVRVDLEALLAIVGQPGGTAWVQSFSHVLALPPGKAPQVAFAEIAVVELRIREAMPAETGGADLGGGRLFRVDAMGASQPLAAGTHLPLREYVNPRSGRRSPVAPARWSAATILSESSWMHVGEGAGEARARAAPRVADAGGEQYVFHDTAAAGLDAGTHSAIVESTGWRVQPPQRRGARVDAGYNHVALLPAGARPWLGEDGDSRVQWLSNATGRKIFQRAALAPAARELLA